MTHTEGNLHPSTPSAKHERLKDSILNAIAAEPMPFYEIIAVLAQIIGAGIVSSNAPIGLTLETVIRNVQAGHEAMLDQQGPLQ